MQTSSMDVIVLAASLASAVLFITVRTLTMQGSLKFKLDERMGPANWDFAASWASTLTAVGALLGSILAVEVLSEETRLLSGGAFAGLNLFFGLLIPIAPLVYNATRSPEETDTPSGKEPQYQGYVWSFLLATVVTLWAVLGELATVSIFLAEMQADGSMSATAILVFQLLLLIAAVFLVVYAWRTIYWSVEEGIDRKAAQRRLFMGIKALGVRPIEIQDETSLKAPLPTWQIL